MSVKVYLEMMNLSARIVVEDAIVKQGWIDSRLMGKSMETMTKVL